MNCKLCSKKKRLAKSQGYFRDTDTIEPILLCTSCGGSIRLSLEENNQLSIDT